MSVNMIFEGTAVEPMALNQEVMGSNLFGCRNNSSIRSSKISNSSFKEDAQVSSL